MSEDKDLEEKQEEQKKDENVEIEFHHQHSEENDALSTAVWAFILIWAGLVFLASNLNWFSRLGFEISTVGPGILPTSVCGI